MSVGDVGEGVLHSSGGSTFSQTFYDREEITVATSDPSGRPKVNEDPRRSSQGPCSTEERGNVNKRWDVYFTPRPQKVK